MRFLIVLAAVVCLVSGQANIADPSDCSNDLDNFCDGRAQFTLSEATDCDSNICGYQIVEGDLRKYVTENIGASYEYLMLSSYYGNYVKNRPGFHKQFKSLADKAWSNAIDLIKFMTKRGGHMVFDGQTISETRQQPIVELDEVHAMGHALDMEKSLAVYANHLHERVSHAAHPKHYDADVAHYIEEEFLESKTKKIRELSGWTNDIKNLLVNDDNSLSLFLFDEYLQKQ